MEERKHIVILAAGDFPTHEVPLRALREADFVVCCDSAYRQWSVVSGQWPVEKSFVVIGDGDSLSEADKDALGDRWIYVGEQDYNDLHKAMDYATSSLITHHSSLITILGATGKREDHTLGNISYLATFAEEHPGIELEMLTDYGRFVALGPTSHLSPLTFHLPSFPRQQVSIFSMNPDAPVSSTGLRWPLDGFRARRWWQASLNEVLGESFTLTAEDWIVVFQTYSPKVTPASV